MPRPILRLLGGFDLEGADLSALGRKARALLAFLAMQSGRSQSREKLAALLWGGSGEAQARMSLRQGLSALRKAFPHREGSWLHADAESVAVVPGVIDLDVARFEQAAADPDAGRLEEALVLYRGDLLDGFVQKEEPFEDWLRVERERLRAVASAVMEKLLAHHASAGDHAAVIRVATRMLVAEPLKEDVHRSLMLAYSAQGRHGLALSQYERCRDDLKRILDVQPEAETRALHEAIRARRSRPAAPADRRETAPGAGGQEDRAAVTPVRPRPTTHYVRSNGVSIAYQVTGDGPVDLVYVQGWVSNLDLAWTSPRMAHVLGRLGSFTRLIRIDKRGTGLSDRGVGYPTLEERMEDVRCVLDAIGSRQAALFGSSEGGNLCMLFAASHPERTAALVLNGSFARGLWAPDYPWAKTREQLEKELAEIERDWGEPADLGKAAPSLAGDAFERQWFAEYLRNSASRADALALWRWNTEIDVRDILPSIRVPTLILQARGDRWVNAEEGRYLARHISGARYVEMAGEDHVIWGSDADRIADEIAEFLAQASASEPAERVLTTLLAMAVAASGGSGEAGDILDADLARELAAAGATDVARSGGILSAAFQGPTRALRFALGWHARAAVNGATPRAAVHIGECERRREGLAGAAIEAVVRLLDAARPGEVLVSRVVRDLAFGAAIRFDERTGPLPAMAGIGEVFSARETGDGARG